MRKNAYEEMFAVEEKHWWYVVLHDLIVLLSQTQFPNRHLSILDAGCGTGGLLSILAGAGYQVEGFDYSEEAIAFCQGRGLKQVFKADINEWEPKPNTYDLIVSMDVLSHTWVRDKAQVLKCLASGLKENGLLMLNDPAFPVLSRHHDQVVMIGARYTKKSYQAYLTEAGLEPVLCSYRLPHAFLILMLLRIYESLNKNSAGAKSDIADIPAHLINQILINLGTFENQIIARGISIPFGSSVFVVAKRKSRAAETVQGQES